MKLRFILPLVIVMVLGMGIISANADYCEGEFGDNVEVEFAYSSAPFYLDLGSDMKKLVDWDGVTEKKNTGKYIYVHVTDKETGEQLRRNKDYVWDSYIDNGGEGPTEWLGVSKAGKYIIKFMYKGDTFGEEKGYIEKSFEVTPVTVAASDIKIKDINNKLPMKYTGKMRKFKPASITIGNSSFLNNGSDYWTITKATYKNATKVGTATAKYTFKFKNGFKGTVTKTFKYKIIPKNVKTKKFYSTKNTITARWYKHTKQTTGYRIKVYRLTGEDYYDEESGEGGTEWKKVKTIYVKSNKATSKKIKNLKKNSWYMVDIQAYKTVNGKKYYSNIASEQIGTKKK